MIGVFVDGSYLWKAWSSVRAGCIDYKGLLQLISRKCRDEVGVAYYYDAVHPNVDATARMNALARAGFRVHANYRVVKEAVRWADGRSAIDPKTGEPLILERQKGVDVGIALGIVTSIVRDRWDHLALVAGDADFAELVQELVERENVGVTIIGHRASISCALLPYARRIIDLETVAVDLALSLKATGIDRRIICGSAAIRSNASRL